MFRRVYGFGYEMIAVIKVTTMTSVTGYWPSLLYLRKRHQNRLPLMNSVPIMPCKNDSQMSKIWGRIGEMRNLRPLFQAPQMEPTRRKSTACCTPHRIAQNVHCRMDWLSAKWTQRWAHRRMIATMSSSGNSKRLLPNWTRHHRWALRKQQIHRLLQLQTIFHVSSPHFDRILGTNMIICCLEEEGGRVQNRYDNEGIV